jgi:glycyl-tRNA synthetase beta subunit
MLPGLANLIFHEQLGSMRDKAIRVETLAGQIAETLDYNEGDRVALERAAHLAKADLASQMVTEMTSLQGEVGALYAEAQGELPGVCAAIREHYFPRYAGDRIPSTRAGLAISLADKVDTLAAFLAIGLEPTGSADPFALRREALGILALLLGSETPLDLRPIIREVVNLTAKGVADEVVTRVLSFIEKRLEIVLREDGLRHDVVRAVLTQQTHTPYRAMTTARELALLCENPTFREFLPAYTRCVRIIRKATTDGIEVAQQVNAQHFGEAAERELWKALADVGPTLTDGESLNDRFTKLLPLQSAINTYFDKVMVMADDGALRANRLGTVQGVVELLEGYADFTALEG